MTGALLLDTHAWLWTIGDEAMLGPVALSEIRSAGKRQAVAVSDISFWEIAIKARKGQFEALPDTDEWLRRASTRPGIGVVEVNRDILIRSALLEWKHRDPADRILVVTALFYDFTLVTLDPPILAYAKTDGRLRVLDART